MKNFFASLVKDMEKAQAFLNRLNYLRLGVTYLVTPVVWLLCFTGLLSQVGIQVPLNAQMFVLVIFMTRFDKFAAMTHNSLVEEVARAHQAELTARLSLHSEQYHVHREPAPEGLFPEDDPLPPGKVN